MRLVLRAVSSVALAVRSATPLSVIRPWMAAALNVPVAVMETAGEGGAWGIALLASYIMQKDTDETLESYLSNKVFADAPGSTIYPDQENVRGFEAFMDRYKAGLIIEKAAVQSMQ